MNVTQTTPALHDCPTGCHKKYIHWRPIFAGAVVALGLTFLFNLLTVGLGLSFFTTDSGGQTVLVFSGLAWMVLGGYITLFIAGWVTGRQVCHGSYHCCVGMVHGFMVWTLYLVASLFIVSHVSDVASLVVLKNAFIANSGHLIDVVAVNKLGVVALSTFIIFAVGALGACIGAYCGIKASERCQVHKDK